MHTENNLRQALDADGFALVDDIVPSGSLDRVVQAVTAVDHEGIVERRGSVHAIRNLLGAVPAVRELARSPEVRSLVEDVLGPEAFAVRGILFDKTPAANWKVTWHQDLTIAVREPRDVPGFGPWSEKAGIPHVQPPTHVLERMLTVRVHLDDCGMENGPVQVIPGSHAFGRIRADAVSDWRAGRDPVFCTTARGGVLLMRPLILHASSPATVPGHRRVVHLEFAADDLPTGLEWHGRW